MDYAVGKLRACKRLLHDGIFCPAMPLARLGKVSPGNIDCVGGGKNAREALYQVFSYIFYFPFFLRSLADCWSTASVITRARANKNRSLRYECSTSRSLCMLHMNR